MQHHNYEIEHKYLVDLSEVDYLSYPYDLIEQAYISTSPVIRIRRCSENYILTVKGSGMVKHLEYELPLSAEQYRNLAIKAEGHKITKKRYYLPYLLGDKEYTIELDIFTDTFAGLVLAEVEFTSEAEAQNFIPPQWFLENVSHRMEYHNSYLSTHGYQAK